ncbi:MAG: response regulator transcription factor [Acidobacteriota bacterium]
MHLLLVEDDPPIRDFIHRALKEEGYQVTAVSTAEEALGPALGGLPDLLIVDLNLPGMDGLDFISRCRAQGVTAPVLILSARRSVDERVKGLEQGGDDYLTKPFSLAELLARIRALLRRGGQSAGSPQELCVGDLKLDLLRREAWRGTCLLPLTAKEFALLDYLCRNAGRVVTRTMILDHVWGMRIDPATNVVDVHIHRLRAKVEGNGPTTRIRTIRGAGYVLQKA